MSVDVVVADEHTTWHCLESRVSVHTEQLVRVPDHTQLQEMQVRVCLQSRWRVYSALVADGWLDILEFRHRCHWKQVLWSRGLPGPGGRSVHLLHGVPKAPGDIWLITIF